MLTLNFKLSKRQKRELVQQLEHAEYRGNLPEVKRLLSILSLDEGKTCSEIAAFLRMTVEAIRGWFRRYLLRGVEGLRTHQRPGRPAKLTQRQRRELSALIEAGPVKSGFLGACWRTPMIQQLILARWGVYYTARYLSQLLNSMGFSFQKAGFVAEGRDEKAREKWLKEQWPVILKQAAKKDAYLLFGDESSYPQWGSLSYTWAKQGQQPMIPTAGCRRGYKVFGLIDYFTGRLFAKGHEGKLNDVSYQAFLLDVLRSTRKHLVLIQDGAPYHTSQSMMEFFYQHRDRITVYQLPTYSPDFNPIEGLWKKIKQQGTHLHYFPTFDSLKAKVNEMLLFFKNAKQEVMALFGFYDKLNTA
jgi:transposase